MPSFCRILLVTIPVHFEATGNASERARGGLVRKMPFPLAFERCLSAGVTTRRACYSYYFVDQRVRVESSFSLLGDRVLRNRWLRLPFLAFSPVTDHNAQVKVGLGGTEGKVTVESYLTEDTCPRRVLVSCRAGRRLLWIQDIMLTCSVAGFSRAVTKLYGD